MNSSRSLTLDRSESASGSMMTLSDGIVGENARRAAVRCGLEGWISAALVCADRLFCTHDADDGRGRAGVSVLARWAGRALSRASCRRGWRRSACGRQDPGDVGLWRSGHPSTLGPAPESLQVVQKLKELFIGLEDIGAQLVG